ncbi:hypothetical protein [Sphingobium fuliginis]|uniref:hypothetical protein n=1 Tax=Sphingobium fuliginis (strain ATCC 27551) TaxID=336203 RepID=UPI00130432DB|nr:hypothetical protein [Sphingobium fuliginis]
MRLPISLVSGIHHDQIKATVFGPRFPRRCAMAQKAQEFREFDSRRPVIDHQEDIKPAFQKNGLQCSGLEGCPSRDLEKPQLATGTA